MWWRLFKQDLYLLLGLCVGQWVVFFWVASYLNSFALLLFGFASFVLGSFAASPIVDRLCHRFKMFRRHRSRKAR